MSLRGGIRWRVWFCSYGGRERYFDVPGPFGSMAVQQAHERFRAEPGTDPMRGWWIDRWQLLAVPVGRWTRHGLVVDPPSLHRRLGMWLRRRRSR